MADLATMEQGIEQRKSGLGSIENQLSQYNTELPSQMETELQRAASPLIKEALGVKTNLMSNYLGDIMGATNLGAGMQGTTAYDLSPSQRMKQIGREMGHFTGELEGAQQYADYLGAQMNDMYGKALQAAQMGQQNLADRYSRGYSMLQLEMQQLESEKDRQQQARLAAQAAAQQQAYNEMLQRQYEQEQARALEVQKKADIDNWYTKVDTIRSNRGTYGNSLDSYQAALLKEAADLGLPYGSEELWEMLGNTPRKFTDTSGFYSGGGGGGSYGYSW